MGVVNTIEYITTASTGNYTDFGDLSDVRRYPQGVSSSTRGIFGGGNPGSFPNVNDEIEYITIASTGNVTDFGNLTVARAQTGAVSSPIRGVFGGGYSPSVVNTIDYITIASTGDAADFGDMAASIFYSHGCSDAHGGLST